MFSALSFFSQSTTFHSLFPNALWVDPLVELGGKIVGMQTETRQGFKNVEARLEMVATKDDLSLVSARFDIQDKKFDHMLAMLTALTPKPE